MSFPSTDLSFSKQDLPLRHTHRQQKTSGEQMDSDMSVKTDSTQASSTPPTIYDDLNNTLSEDDVEHDVKDQEAESLSDSDNEQKKKEIIIDPICAGEADGQCTLNSGDHRKVTSHVFGRNKRETHQIPEECWIKYCRKHYQRQKYRCPADWFETQLLLVDGQLDRLEAWGGVIDWTIQLRKKERENVDKENHHQAIHGSLPDGPLSRERFLLPYLGPNKTFAEVRAVVDVINKECDDTQNLTLPSFEFLPRIDERRNPRPRRGVARRGTRQSVQRTPAAPSTFRLTTDGSGQLTKIETKPRQTSGTGYALAKQRTLAKKRSSSALNVDQTPEPGANISKKHKSSFHAVNKQTPPPSDDDDKKMVGDEVQHLVENPVSSASNDKGKNDTTVSNQFPRPVKRHRRSRSL
ncbi:MAG: hypothetical protein L6R38_005423 [Xanthoria sp. 2 TBL-2021]|nr:MAG: hypothetical protein L6R38_005423 [Xanthoria sp. 2 TBL-2021]